MNADRVENIISNAEEKLTGCFARLDRIALNNQKKVLDAFRNNAIQARHLYGTTGYGYDDGGRDSLCALYRDVFHSESAIVSPLIVSGTHALTLMLFGVLRPGDTLLAVSGMPYDTLTDVISGENNGSLKDFGVNFDCIQLIDNGDLTVSFDFEKIEKSLKNKPIKAVFLARSRGYSWREAISVQKIKELILFVKSVSPETLVLVDNCYGEFVEELEPTDVGADLIAGSLIKNAGGGIAPTGGYIAGKEDLCRLVSFRLTAPSLGMEEGSYAYGYIPYYQGLFLAPSVVKNALRASLLFAECYSSLGFETLPVGGGNPYDLVTSIKLDSARQIVDFCGAIQEISPIDSNVKPEPWDMPGYQNQVVMAAGAFIQGSSIELSADAPIKEPYIVYVQGGLTYEHARLAVAHTLKSLNK